MRKAKKITIIGGGISGLAAAYEISRRNRSAGHQVELELLEQAPEAGGKIITRRDGDFLVEGGPDCFIIEKPWALQLIREIGLENELLNTSSETSGTFVYDNRALHRLPEGVMMMVPTRPGPFLKSKLISWPGKIRMGLEVAIPRRKEEGDETLASFVRRRLGREALDKLAEPLIDGIHAGNPENMSLLSTFPRFLEMEKEYGSLIIGMLMRQKKMKEMMKNRPPSPGPKRTFFISLKGGLGCLIDELVRVVGKENIKLKQTVENISPKPGGGWLVKKEGAETAAPTDAVVLAAEAFNSARMLEVEMPRLADLLRGIPYVSSATVSLAYQRRDIPHPLDSYGFIVPRIANRRIMAVTWSSIKWDHRAPEGMVLMRAFVGGAQRPELAAVGDQEMMSLVREELNVIMGISSPPKQHWIYRWPEGMPQYIIGHPDRLEAIDQIIDETRGLFLTGAGYRGIGIPDCINQARQAAVQAWQLLD